MGREPTALRRCALGPGPCGISIVPGVIPAGFWAEHGEIRLEVATSGGSSPVGGFGRWDAHGAHTACYQAGRLNLSRLGVFFLSRQGKSAMLTCSNEHLPNFMRTLRNSDFF